MDALLKAIEICGSQAGLAKSITENLPEGVTEAVTPQQVWNWLNRDKIVPCQYCPTIEKICDGKVVCEDLNPLADWEYLRSAPKKIPVLVTADQRTRERRKGSGRRKNDSKG